MRTTLLHSLALTSMAVCLLLSEPAQATEQCASQKASPATRRHIEKLAGQALGAATFEPGSFYYCAYSASAAEASVKLPEQFDEAGVATARWAYCQKSARRQTPAWQCWAQQMTKVKVAAEVNGTPVTVIAGLEDGIAPEEARPWIKQALSAAAASKLATSCEKSSSEEEHAKFINVFTNAGPEELYLAFREGVLEIQRGEAGVKLAPVNRDIKHFEYGCWTTYDTL